MPDGPLDYFSLAHTNNKKTLFMGVYYNMKWHTFRHAPSESDTLPRRACNTERHKGMDIPAYHVEMVWTPVPAKLEDTLVHALWFTCQECHNLLWDSFRED